jgi:hypothetical protein
MSDNPCQHKVLEDVRVVRCVPHSEVSVGIDVWVWSFRPLPLGCSCEVGTGRFVIATDEADMWSTSDADVGLCSCRDTLRGAIGVAQLWMDRHPGCTLVTVPTRREGTVFRTHSHRLVVAAEQVPPPVCEVCLYPWLAAGHTLDELS